MIMTLRKSVGSRGLDLRSDYHGRVAILGIGARSVIQLTYNTYLLDPLPTGLFFHPFSLQSIMSSAERVNVSPMPPGVTDSDYKPLPGRLGNLTAVEQHALDTLKKKLQDGGHFVPERMDDATLLR